MQCQMLEAETWIPEGEKTGSGLGQAVGHWLCLSVGFAKYVDFSDA
jgi:hypothetical protein